ncbi:unnamed protein product [Amaranthus hypochondriacus]
MELMFADDLHSFTKYDIHSLSILKLVIDDFSKSFGLHINYSKSAIYLAGVHKDDDMKILDAIGVPKEDLPFRYLGFPLSSKRIAFVDCKSLVIKITTRIKHWTSRKLFMAGGVQLVDSTIRGSKPRIAWEHVCLLKSFGG